MINLVDIAVVAVGFIAGLTFGYLRGIKEGKDRFWKMPSASWKARNR
ncbi:MAG: hypothetical protein GOV00_02605 [Candidatus Altiarchaeota archaeon]|nr:hypothetical protein [Candidatus Altiarchaeota archaeon]